MTPRRLRVCVVVGGLAWLSPGLARAEPYRLRADAFVDSADPAAFVMLSARARERRPLMVDAEALVWVGGTLDPEGDASPAGEAVLASVRLRDPSGLSELRLGRLMYSGGGVRPLHVDGAVATIRSETGARLEAFGGMPVEPRFEGRGAEWLVGMRATQSASEYGMVGFSYWQERDAGAIARSELGLEGVATPARALSFRTTAAIETVRFGLAEARASAVLADGLNRLELFGLRRSPSLMLPATSLFAALGSYDADAVGLSGFWRAAPRLDLTVDSTVERVDEQPAATELARAELRLDDDGDGAIGVEVRRVSMPSASWTGARTWVRLPIVETLSTSAEVEVAIPDDPRGRGAAWPWGLLALRWKPVPAFDVAGAFEASATPKNEVGLGGLLRASVTWESRR